jgi:hypothetical protein
MAGTALTRAGRGSGSAAAIPSSYVQPHRDAAPSLEERELEAVSGERPRKIGALEGAAVRREHVLDRELEQRAQPLGDALTRHAGAKPSLVDLEAMAEVDERVAGDHRAVALECQRPGRSSRTGTIHSVEPVRPRSARLLERRAVDAKRAQVRSQLTDRE